MGGDPAARREVGWRFFVVGEAVYFMSEQQPLRAPARYTFTPTSTTPCSTSPTTSTGASPRQRVHMTVARSTTGGRRPARRACLDGWGPPDGRWLITGVRRDWFEPTAEVTLKQPGEAEAGTRAEAGQRATSRRHRRQPTGAGGSSKARAAVRGAQGDQQELPVRVGRRARPARHPRTAAPAATPASATTAQVRAVPRSRRPGSATRSEARRRVRPDGEQGDRREGDGATINANGQHVWIEFHLPANRAGGSTPAAHGCGDANGPRVRSCSRHDQGSFAGISAGCDCRTRRDHSARQRPPRPARP